MTIRQWLTKYFGSIFAKELAKKNNTVPIIPLNPGVPAAPVEQKACTCDLTKPLVTPLVPYLGPDDAAVDKVLYDRWKSGLSDTCGGLPGDTRPLAIRLNGKTFGWKDPVTTGAVKIVIDGEQMTIFCGAYKGQQWHPIGGSDHEMPANGKPETLSDWLPITPGVKGMRRHFVYFQCR